MKLAFLLMTEYMKSQHVYTMLKMIDAATAKGHEVLGIFLFGNGVLNARKEIKISASSINIPEKLSEYAGKYGFKIYACQTWADNFGLFPENTVSNVEIVGLGELSDLTAAADKLIAFGTGI